MSRPPTSELPPRSQNQKHTQESSSPSFFPPNIPPSSHFSFPLTAGLDPLTRRTPSKNPTPKHHAVVLPPKCGPNSPSPSFSPPHHSTMSRLYIGSAPLSPLALRREGGKRWAHPESFLSHPHKQNPGGHSFTPVNPATRSPKEGSIAIMPWGEGDDNRERGKEGPGG